MEKVEYSHARNLHTLRGSCDGLAEIFKDCGIAEPNSLLDVGAGSGHWLKAAMECGVYDVLGVDGVPTTGRSLEVSSDLIMLADLRKHLDLGRQFDIAICLEVAEHLPEEAASTLVSSLCRHADIIYFSAAIPYQGGDHHINCQWPEYWQRLFNDQGFACEDKIRWRIWKIRSIEPWYRQNMMKSTRSPIAGSEARILPCIHPDMLDCLTYVSASISGRTHAKAAGKAMLRKFMAPLEPAMR